MRSWNNAWVVVVVGLAVLACKGGGGSGGVLSRVVVDDHEVLKDGDERYWKLSPGQYRAQVTGTDDSVEVNWVGASCRGAKKVGTYDVNCTLTSPGQLVVKNPPGFLGLGKGTSVTVKVTRLK